MSNLFKPAEATMAFAKVGLHGPAGSGKTRTAWEIARGLHGAIKSKKPVAMMDTETGSDFIIPLAKKAGIKMVVSRSRAFKDLVTGAKEAEGVTDILIIDSISHFWVDLFESYKKKKNTNDLTFQAWGILKPMWAEFSTWYVTSPLHVIVCGRAGDIWDYFENEEGKMELYKVGTRMKAEKEFGYEASLVIEMEQLRNPGATEEYRQAKAKKQREIAAKKMREERQWVRRATVLKDRADVLDGQFFDDPTYKDFAPHWQYLNVGGEHHPLDVGDSQDLFDIEGKPEWKKEREQCAVAIEEIDAELIKIGLDGRKDQDKKNRILMLEWIFGTSSKAAIEGMKLPQLKNGLAVLKVVRQYNPFAELMEKITKQDITLEQFKENFGPRENEPDIPLNPGDEMVKCPNLNTEVAKKYCDSSCQHREGCPVFD